MTLAGAVLSALLAVNNTDSVTLSLWPLDMAFLLPLWLVIAVAFGVGLLIGAATMLPLYFKTRFALRQKTKSLEKMAQTDANDQKNAAKMPQKIS